MLLNERIILRDEILGHHEVGKKLNEDEINTKRKVGT